MTDEQNRRVLRELAELTESLRRFERNMGYGSQDQGYGPFASSFWPGGAMDPDFGYEPAWRGDDDMPDYLRPMFERMERVDREYDDDEPPYDPEHPAPELVHRILDDYEITTGRLIDWEFGEVLTMAYEVIGSARQTIRENGYFNLFSKAGRAVLRAVSLDEIELINQTRAEEFEDFPPLANLLRDVQQAYGHLRITDV